MFSQLYELIELNTTIYIYLLLENNNIQLRANKGVYYLPDGAVMINSSRVMHFPPALTILALAVSVNLKAAIVIFGTSRSLTSSVTEATTTAIFSLKQSTYNKLSDLVWYLLSLEELVDLGDRNRWSIDSRRDKSSQNSLWKSWSSSSCEESEKLYHQKTLGWMTVFTTYLDEKMNIKVGASCVLLVRILNSTSFDESYTLYETHVVSNPS